MLEITLFSTHKVPEFIILKTYFMKTNVSSSLKVVAFAMLLLVCNSFNRANAQQFLTKIDGWNAYVHLPAEYADSSHKNYPLIIFVPGIGEVGTNPSKLLLNGPAKFIAAGASMEFNVNGKIEKPIVISIQPIDPWAPNPFVVNRKVDSILARWRIDPQRISGTGLSMGGQTWQNFVNTGNAVLTNRLASIVAMSAPGPDNGVNGMKNFVINGGKWWGFEGTTDYRGMDQIRDVMNSNVPGSARYFQYVGGHCCWNTWYVPTWNENGESIYTWMLKQKRPAGSNITPEANAGSDTSTVALVTSLPLKGNGNDPDGNPISFAWIKLSGPAGGTITNSAAAQTNATGLSVGSYLFELAVTDVLGAVSKDTVTINNGNFVLPLQIAQFSGIDKHDHVLLQWTSKEELNTSHFEIEKRSNTQAYRKVTQVTAKGFSSTENKYEFKDMSAELGFNYYRLKMIDLDGTYTYSDVLAIEIKKVKLASLQVLDVSYRGNAVNININSSQQANHALLLTDATGKVLYKSSVVLNKGINHVIVPAILPIAIYHASILDGHQKITHSFSVL
jgi:hypothetical protein